MNTTTQHFSLLFIIFITISSTLSAQFDSRGKEFNYLDAESFYEAKNYYDALPLYQLLLDENPKTIEYQLKIGICHLHLGNSTEKAIEYIEKVYARKPKEQDVLYYLGKAYAINYKFDLAIETFEKALTSKSVSNKLKEEIPNLINQCNNAITLMKDSLPVTIVNLGEPINSVNNEYSPTVSADETTLIFTYKGIKSKGQRQDVFNRREVNGSFYEDMLVSNFVSGAWTNPIPIGDSINTEFHEASISLSPDGQKLLFYKNVPKFSGDILEVNKIDGKWGEPNSLSINTKYWEGHAAVSPNGRFMIFSSEREGGLGKNDLYSAVLQEDSTWGEVKNLGPTINTPYNDDAPFIHSDGVTFSFSSEGHNSMGGYDIFESKIVTDSSYLKPRNIGYPINTTANDIFFYVSGKGNAYYSSAKKGGYGQQDIYVINVKEIVTSKPVLLVKGIITKNRKFGSSIIKVKTQSGKDLGVVYRSDLADGKYQFYLDLNESYEITYQEDELPEQVVNVDATEYTEYTEVEQNISFVENNVTIEGVALRKETPQTPLMNMRVRITNKDNTFSAVDSTDEYGRYIFKKLPNDEYYIMFLNQEDEKKIGDSTYFFKGRVTIGNSPFTEVTINEMTVTDNGDFTIEATNKTYFALLSGNSSDKLNEMNMEDILNKYGDQKADNLIYTIQVGAYANPKSYNYDSLKELGEISSIMLGDGLTRFMIGNFETLRDADSFRQKVVGEGQKDAFILMLLDDKRTFLEELLKNEIFK